MQPPPHQLRGPRGPLAPSLRALVRQTGTDSTVTNDPAALATLRAGAKQSPGGGRGGAHGADMRAQVPVQSLAANNHAAQTLVKSARL